jgi:hypothetical protein
MQLSPSSRSFIPPRSKHSPMQPVLKHPQYVFSLKSRDKVSPVWKKRLICNTIYFNIQVSSYQSEDKRFWSARQQTLPKHSALSEHHKTNGLFVSGKSLRSSNTPFSWWEILTPAQFPSRRSNIFRLSVTVCSVNTQLPPQIQRPFPLSEQWDEFIHPHHPPPLPRTVTVQWT